MNKEEDAPNPPTANCCGSVLEVKCFAKITLGGLKTKYLPTPKGGSASLEEVRVEGGVTQKCSDSHVKPVPDVPQSHSARDIIVGLAE